MKKLLLILTLSLVVPSLAFAKCDGGREITGKNGHSYCISKKGMNWWSAVTWCEANERSLATMQQACDNPSPLTCLNLSVDINKGAWTSTVSTKAAGAAGRIYMTTGIVATSKLNYAGNIALCY